MERRQLEYLVAIVEHGGFTRAAKALHVAQPSLSRAISKLERQLGVSLFHRVGRNVVLSTAGELMADRARHVLRDLDALRAAAQAAGAGVVGRVDVAATSSSALEPIISTIAAMRKDHSSVTVSTWSARSAAEVIAMVLGGRCEVGVCGNAEQPAGQALVAYHLRDEEFLLVAPPGTKLGSDGTVTREELQGLNFVAPQPATAVRARLDRLAAAVGELHIVAEVGERGMVLPMVLQGIGVSLMPDGWESLARRAGAEVYQLSPAESIPQWLVHRSQPLTSAAQAFIDTTLTLVMDKPGDR
ncbi:LysR family transcriptional regulator [Nocardia sp. NPDC052566]|uniref:LysR family transcriptional regulator n=1 Tax=Nocardia sp. NPDC052566 TaxID=3364330 RepID=UPI0037C4F33D